jgi:hypothetical protein
MTWRELYLAKNCITEASKHCKWKCGLITRPCGANSWIKKIKSNQNHFSFRHAISITARKETTNVNVTWCCCHKTQTHSLSWVIYLSLVSIHWRNQKPQTRMCFYLSSYGSSYLQNLAETHHHIWRINNIQWQRHWKLGPMQKFIEWFGFYGQNILPPQKFPAIW